jgi:hypothetical protein
VNLKKSLDELSGDPLMIYIRKFKRGAIMTSKNKKEA